MNRSQFTLTAAMAAVSIQMLWLLTACAQPAATVEVTRLVERQVTVPASPAAVDGEATSVPSPVPATTVVTATVVVQVTPRPLGTDERPVQLLFPPVTNTAVIMQRGEALVEALEAATGAKFVVGIPDDEQTVVDLLCSAPGDTIAFLSAAAYTIAHDRCRAEAALVARGNDGLTWETGMIVTRAGGGIRELADLAGKRWVVADSGNLATDLYFRAMMATAGVTPGEVVTVPEETSALLALRDGEADFATATFVPPLMPFDRPWIFGETSPEEWRLLGISPTRSPIGYVVVAGDPENGGYRLRDARARLFDTTPDIFDVTRILELSAPIPRETVVVGADFPFALARQTVATLAEFAASEACQTSLCSADLYGWTGLEPADDTDYDPIRLIADTLDLEATDFWTETN